MTDMLANQRAPHRATRLPERLRAALAAIGPENGKRAERQGGARTAAQAGPIPSAEAWFAAGERVGYDPNTRTIVPAQDAPLRIYLSREGDLSQAVSFLPGFPDGSFGWAKVRPHLPSAAEMPKLFVDYVGMGDSDKPKDYPYSTAERTDLVEAIWRDLGVQSTTLVGFDFSSLVILEHLRRRLERSARGEPLGGPDIRGVFIFNGGLFTDGHSHPWYTTPMLRRLPERARRRLGQPFALFKRMPGVRKMWSKGYRVTDAELRELHGTMDRHDGLFYLSAAAGFVHRLSRRVSVPGGRQRRRSVRAAADRLRATAALQAGPPDRAVAWRSPDHERAARGAGWVDCEVRAFVKRQTSLMLLR